MAVDCQLLSISEAIIPVIFTALLLALFHRSCLYSLSKPSLTQTAALRLCCFVLYVRCLAVSRALAHITQRTHFVLSCVVYLAVSSSSFIPIVFFFRKSLGSEFKTSERTIIIALRKRVNTS